MFCCNIEKNKIFCKLAHCIFVYLHETIGGMNQRSVAVCMKKVPRSDFVAEEAGTIAYFDVALPIGYGQTVSQPSTVKKMLEWLDVREGNRVLDVGSGSGWTTALLSQLVGNSGHVYAVEKIPQLLEYGRANCENKQCGNVDFHKSGQVVGLPLFSPYDRILVSAAAPELPEELISQLKVGGKMVIPVQNDILVITKRSAENYDVKTHHGFVFVPLVR